MFETFHMAEDASGKPVLEWGEFRPGYSIDDIKDGADKQFLAGMQYMADELVERLANDIDGTDDVPATFAKAMEEMREIAAQQLASHAFYAMYDMAISILEGQGDEDED